MSTKYYVFINQDGFACKVPNLKHASATDINMLEKVLGQSFKRMTYSEIREFNRNLRNPNNSICSIKL
jgi:hypothetical protein